ASDGYWRAGKYLSVGRIALLDNPRLREPLARDHVKPRLLGHFGTTPGLNLVYVHLNRAIRERDLNAIYVTGPGHGGPGLVANAYLEGTYSEVYSAIGDGEDGLRKLFRQFSFPGGIPSHVAPPVADDRAAHTEGLDVPERGRRSPDRGHVAGTPGARLGRAREPGASANSRGVAAELSPRRAVRRRGPAERRARSAGAPRR